MKKSKFVEGQISVFLLIVLMAVILLGGIVVDIARIYSAEAQAKRAVETAVNSALSEYASTLREEYGIFAINKDEYELGNNITENISRNLVIEGLNSGEGEVYLDLYDFRIEGVRVTPLFNLTENEVVKSQILEYMKYRAPKEMVENIWEKLSAIKDSGKMAGSYNKKLTVDKLLADMGSRQEALKGIIFGTVGDKLVEQFNVSAFNRNGIRNKVVTELAEHICEYRAIKNLLNKLDEEIESIKSQLKNVEDKDKKDSLKEEIETVENDREETIQKLNDAKNDMNEAKKDLINNHTKGFLNSNIKALDYVRKIIDLGKKTGSAISRLEEFVTESFKQTESYCGGFVSTIEQDLSCYKEMILEGESAENLVDSLESNIECLEKLLEKAQQLESKLSRIEDFTLGKEDIIRFLNEGVIQYNGRLDYDYTKPEKVENVYDPRGQMAEAGRESIRVTEGTDRDIANIGIAMEELPSNKKKVSVSFEMEDSKYIDGKKGDNEEAPIGNNDENDGRWGLSIEEIEFKNRDAKYSENAMGILSQIGSSFDKGLSEMRNELYINEYIMGTFKNSVKGLKDSSEEKENLDLRGIGKSKRDTFFESEVEYVLHGNSSENMNKLLTKGQILLMRFGVNALHVYTDKQKKLFANSVAAGIAGWWTAGAGIPLISNLIMCGWGMGEAVLDVNELMDGKSVPFYKTEKDWKLDIGLSPEDMGKDNDSKHNLLFSYYDYLRVFLLLKSTEQKLNRIEDLIQLNIQKNKPGFTMSETSTYIRAEVEVSINYFFFTPLFVPEERKTPDGRHRISVLIYEGYDK